jgi:cytochrome b6-f complex iron-sulfur subunit
MSWILPARSQDVDLENLCLSSPENSRCRDYLPGVRALDSQNHPILVSELLTVVTPGQPVGVNGLQANHPTYLVITEGPKIAPYAIQPICTHLGCTVKWHADQNRFICPCHGSQYNDQGVVLQGPASRPLPLVTVVLKQDQVRLVDRAPTTDPRSSK